MKRDLYREIPGDRHFLLRPGAIWLIGHLILISFFLSACGLSTPAPSTAPPPTQERAGEETPVPLPTDRPTPTPLPPERIILYAPEAGDSPLLEDAAVELQAMAAQLGILFEQHSSLTPADLDQGVRLVAALYPAADISELAKTAPGTQFVVFGSSEISSGPNLTLIDTGSHSQETAFMAGYIAAVVTPDWRVGMLGIANEGSPRVTQGFKTGSIYFCGLCRQVYPPFYDAQGVYIRYPLVAEISEGASQAERQSAADYLIERGVKTVYLPAGLNDEVLIEYLVQGGVNIIADFAPAPDKRGNWVATVGIDPLPVLVNGIQQALSSEPGAPAESSLRFENVNEALFSIGRQELARRTLGELTAGYINPGTLDPE